MWDMFAYTTVLCRRKYDKQITSVPVWEVQYMQITSMPGCTITRLAGHEDTRLPDCQDRCRAWGSRCRELRESDPNKGRFSSTVAYCLLSTVTKSEVTFSFSIHRSQYRIFPLPQNLKSAICNNVPNIVYPITNLNLNLNRTSILYNRGRQVDYRA